MSRERPEPEPPPPVSREPAPPAPRRARVRGIDMARAAAIVGMVMVHFGPVTADGELAELVYSATHGRAAILFALLAGVGVAMLAGDGSPERNQTLYVKLGVRVAVLLPLGLLLQMPPSGVAVILHFYAAYFVIAGVAVRCSDRVLLLGAAAVLVVGPMLVTAAELRRPAWFERAPATLEDWSEPLVILQELLVVGAYPVVVWTAPVLVGLWLGRRDLARSGVQWRVGISGLAAVALAYAAEALARVWIAEPADEPAWGQLVSTTAHSQMGPWMLQAIGVAAVVLAACVFLGERLPRAVWPLAAMGQLALSIYVAHVLLLAYLPDPFVRETAAGAAFTVARFAVLAAAFAVLWRSFQPRGPLELILNLPGERGGRGRR